MQHAIFWPVIAQVLLIAVVWIRMYQTRIREIRARGIDPQSVNTSHAATGVLRDVSASDNFRNLFEVPVLFLAVCIALAVTDHVNVLQLTLAWIYVGLRGVHSLIHVTYNRVMHRFAVYALSTLCVFVMWILFGVSLWRSP